MTDSDVTLDAGLLSFGEPPADAASLRTALLQRLARQTKPPGSLGQLEALALQIGLLQQRQAPRLESAQQVVFAADHGLAAHGVSAYPQAVTAQMVLNFARGGAAISVLTRQHGIDLTIVDAGVAVELDERALQEALATAGPTSDRTPGRICRFESRRIGPGTADASTGPAMTPTQCSRAIEQGAEVVRGLPGNVLLLGEMGIGNSSSAALLMARLGGLPLAECVGRGTGLDDDGLRRKLAVLARVLERHEAARTPLAALAAFGGFELAMLVGAALQAARERRLVVVDGFIVTAAILVAARLAPALLQACVFAHCSDEAGHARLLDLLGVRALLRLGLRLGEGSGAALAWPLIDSAVRLLDGMATFESAGVSDRGPAAGGR
jgi:nicotinate-nucleotide--dimethylbenzimidazole phosphoribosyltransferase